MQKFIAKISTVAVLALAALPALGLSQLAYAQDAQAPAAQTQLPR